MSETLDRQEFLRRMGRGGLLLGLSGMSVAALQGSKDPSECFNHNYCNSCSVHRTCELPEKKEVTHERSPNA